MSDLSAEASKDSQLERAWTQWQFGDWESLSEIDKTSLQHHPDRAKLALLAAAGCFQLGKHLSARTFIRLSEGWGVSRQLTSRLLVAGAHNSIARALAIDNQPDKALEHFERAVSVGIPAIATDLVAKARANFELDALGLPSDSQITLRKRNALVKQVQKSLSSEKSAAVFTAMFDNCKPYLNEGMLGSLDRLFTTGLERIASGTASKPECVLTDLITVDDAYLAFDKPLRFAEKKDLPILIREILIEKNYYFDCANSNPLIIDGGANFGLAAFFFKKQYPKSKVIAFEPNPILASIFRENIECQGWDGVILEEYAISPSEGSCTLYVPEGMPMGGSQSTRLKDKGWATVEFDVKSRRLSDYLSEHVDLLKLDIEGIEVDVLESCEESLNNVDNLFCEFHFGSDMPTGRLARLLAVLDRAGFKYSLDSGLRDSAIDKVPAWFLNAANGKSLNVFAVRSSD